jgi:hypothetical protein
LDFTEKILQIIITKVVLVSSNIGKRKEKFHNRVKKKTLNEHGKKPFYILNFFSLLAGIVSLDELECSDYFKASIGFFNCVYV